MLRNYFKIAIRNIFKNKVTGAIKVLGLGLGMATAALLLTWSFNESNYDNYHSKADQIYRVNSHLQLNKGETWHWASSPLRLAEKLQSTFSEIENYAKSYEPWSDVMAKVNNVPIKLEDFVYVDKNWFELFDHEIIEGNVVAFSKNLDAVVITESAAKNLLGEGPYTGKQIEINDSFFVVRMVIADHPTNSSFPYEIYARNDFRLNNPEVLQEEDNWNNYDYQAYVSINSLIQIEKLEAKATTLFRELSEDENASKSISFQPLKEIHNDTETTYGAVKPPVPLRTIYVFIAIALLILLIACINYINLTTVEVNLRIKEVSVKKLNGASKKSLFTQFFVESTLNSLVALLLALTILALCLPYFNAYTELNFSFGRSEVLWFTTVLTFVFTLVISGIYPSIVLSNLRPMEHLQKRTQSLLSQEYVRKGLVVFQFAITIALLVGAFTIQRQFKFIQDKDLGYQKDHIFTLQIPYSEGGERGLHKVIASELKKSSDVIDITLSSDELVNIQSKHSGSLDWEGKREDWDPVVTQMSVGENYNDFFGLKLAEGRWFDINNSADINNVILNKTSLKEFGIESPAVGKFFEYQRRKGQIIGVVDDFHFESPRKAISPLLLFKRTDWMSTINVKVHPSKVKNAISTAENVWNKYITTTPFTYNFLDTEYERMHESESKQLQLFYSFAAILLLISIVGLYGLASFAAQRRTKEMGIRKVLGASVVSILGLLSKEFLKLILLACVVAIPLAFWAVNSWLQDYAYHIEVKWWLFAIPLILVALVTLITVNFQGLKTALINPVKSLKNE